MRVGETLHTTYRLAMETFWSAPAKHTPAALEGYEVIIIILTADVGSKRSLHKIYCCIGCSEAV